MNMHYLREAQQMQEHQRQLLREAEKARQVKPSQRRGITSSALARTGELMIYLGQNLQERYGEDQHQTEPIHNHQPRHAAV